MVKIKLDIGAQCIVLLKYIVDKTKGKVDKNNSRLFPWQHHVTGETILNGGVKSSEKSTIQNS